MSSNVIPGSPLEQSILAAIRRIIRAVDLYSRQLVESYGLTGPQLATLQELARGRSVSAGKLARSLHVSQATMTGILDRLERASLVSRSRNGTDRRSVNITMTEKGSSLIGRAPSLLQDRFCERLSRMQEWEQTLLLANLQRVASMMDAADLDAAPLLTSGADRL